jgi:hypothetical protein
MIPTRYINAGPMQPKASAGAAMAAGQAVESIGAAITDVGQSTLAVAGKLRKIKEAGAINAFMAQADEEAGRFAIELARRSDTEAWPADWQSRASKLREKAQGLGLSPEAMGALDSQFSNWSSTRSIHFETQAASKELGIARSRTTQALDYSLARGDKEGYERALDTAKAGGVLNPAEEEQARAVFKTNEAALDLDRLVEGNPQGVIDTPEEQFLKTMPGATLEQVAAAKRKAEAKKEDYRVAEMDRAELAMIDGKLTPQDIEASQYLSKADQRNLTLALKQKNPPAQEQHAKAWWVLDQLRSLRDDPGVTPEMYRSAWNEARGTVMGSIAPQWQGDIRQELGYLSPAGRSPDAPVSRAYDASDLEAIGRDVAFRARDAGVFGDPEEKDFTKREAVFRKAEDIRLHVKRYVASNSKASVEDVRAYADKLTGVAMDSGASLLPPIPPAIDFGADIDRIMNMTPLPGLAPGPGESNGDLLPPKP